MVSFLHLLTACGAANRLLFFLLLFFLLLLALLLLGFSRLQRSDHGLRARHKVNNISSSSFMHEIGT